MFKVFFYINELNDIQKENLKNKLIGKKIPPLRNKGGIYNYLISKNIFYKTEYIIYIIFNLYNILHFIFFNELYVIF